MKFRQLFTIATIIVLASFSTGCVGEERAAEAITHAGYSSPIVGGYDHFGCSESDDLVGRQASGVNANGERVPLTVCCGYFKACTIRF